MSAQAPVGYADHDQPYILTTFGYKMGGSSIVSALRDCFVANAPRNDRNGWGRTRGERALRGVPLGTTATTDGAARRACAGDPVRPGGVSIKLSRYVFVL